MDQVEEIKSKVDIVELIQGYLSLKKAGRNFKANCPFHGEKTPSFMVNSELQIFKCFGCGVGGDVYTFLQNMEGVTFGEALKILADRVGIKLTSYKPSKQEEERERLIQINTLAAEAYQYLLTKHKTGKRAREYLAKRGVSEQSVNKFGLGYAPSEWNFLSDFLVKKKKLSIYDLIKTGLLVEGKNYDRFRDRIMFPLNNGRGEVMGFAGRIMPDVKIEGGKYVNTPETEIYHKSELLYGFDITRSEIKTSRFAVVVEGELDAICTYQVGIKNVVAIKGSALTEKQVETLGRVTDRLVLALDADMAGNMAARRGIEMAEKKGLFVETVNWNLVSEEAKDAADLAIGSPEKLKELINKPISIYTFFIDTAIKKFGNTIEGKTRVIRDVLPLLAMIGDEVRKDEYLKELANKTQTNIDAIRRELNRFRPPTVNDKTEVNVQSLLFNRGDMLEEYLVGLAIRNNRVDLLNNVFDLFKNEFWRKVLVEFNSGKTVTNMPEELKLRTQELVLREDEKELDFEKEWGKATFELEELRVREKIPNAVEQELLKLTKRLSELTRGV